jgi:hypothetical protein
VALPMDEQRILEEMERMLAADDPKLAARLAAFGQPGFGQVLRTRRARATISAIALVLIAGVAAVIFIMSSLRPGGTTNSPVPRSAQSATPRPEPTSPTAALRISLCAAAPLPQCGRQWAVPRTGLPSANPAPSR